jgi:hypothetical protein
MDPQTTMRTDSPDKTAFTQKIQRRSFLRFTGVAASVALVAVSCKDDKETVDMNGGVNLGSGDTGILNYASALEQLEAAFYTQVLATPYSGITVAESALLADIRDHEIAHREFFKNALSSNAIPSLEVDFSTINFSDRNSVLNTAKAFEDLGVAAYNGAGKLITTAAYLTLAGKIVSVEARHAAWIRDILNPGSFADSSAIDANGQDLAKDPKDVLPIAQTFLKTKISGSNLPTT